MNLSRMNVLGCCLGGLLSLGLPFAAHAQETGDAAAPASADTVGTIPVSAIASPPTEPAPETSATAGPTQLKEVVVTSTKRAAPVRRIAGTVNVLSGEDLEREGVQSVDEIVMRVPGVNLTDEGTGGTAKRITIRGISSGTGVNPTAGTLFGDIPVSDPFIPKVALDPNPFDMATVEVLKGPQGTLFGGTGLNGLIRYVPEAPKFDAVQIKYYTQLSSYPKNGGSAWNYGAALNAPFANDKAAIRLMGFHRNSPGYTDNTRAGGKPDVNTLEQEGYRAQLAWLPAEHWKVGLMAATQKMREDDIGYTTNYDGQLEHDDSPRASPSISSYSLGSLNIEREFSWASLISQTSYFEKKFNIFLEASRAFGGVAPILAAADDNHSEGITQEFRLVSAPGPSPWKWLVGGVYYQLDLYDCATAGLAQGLPTLPSIPGLEGLVLPPCPGNLSRIGDQFILGQIVGDIELKEKAVFGEVARKLGKHWEATLGARVYRISSAGTVSNAGAVYAPANQGGDPVRDAGITEDGLSPKASIVFAPTRDFRSYFTVSRGFRFGAPQLSASTPTTTVPETYKSDSLWNYELGVRTDWFRRSLRFDASAYVIAWNNPQVYQQVTTGVVGVGFIDNVGGAKGQGVEASLRYLAPFAPGLSLEVTAALNKTVTTAPFTAADGTDVPTGSPWPLTPRWQTSSTLAYTLPMDAWQAGASLRYSYLGSACNAIECSAQVFGYRTMDFNVFASGPAGSFWPQLSLSLNNLTDERGYSNVTTNPAPASDTINYIAPRALVLRLSGSF